MPGIIIIGHSFLYDEYVSAGTPHRYAITPSDVEPTGIDLVGLNDPSLTQQANRLRIHEASTPTVLKRTPGRSLTGSSERYRLIPFLHPSEAITNKTWSQVHSGSELHSAHYALFSLFLKCRTRHAKFLATPINGYQARAPRHLFFRQPARYREKPHPE